MADFATLTLKTTKDTFIPRPETELLVETCLNTINGACSILDIGTGTGNIAISLTIANEKCKIKALDCSNAVLEVARENGRIYKVTDRIEFIKSNIYSSLSHNYHNSFDMIVSNPPYIPGWEIETLAEHVKEEPRIALDGGKDGLDYYKEIISGAKAFLKPGGYIIMELGYNQSHAVKKILHDAGNFSNIEIFKDFSNIDRVIKAQWTS